jgi:predicted amidohydrolase
MRARTLATTLLVAVAALTPAAAARAKTVRVFAAGPKFSLDWVDTRAHFHDKLFALADARRRTATAPGVQRAARDVASRLLGPTDPQRPAATARDLVTLPEDLGLMAAFTGSRGAQARRATDIVGAIIALLGAYGTDSAHYVAKFPALAARPFPPTRALALALTDTFVRTGVETFAELADRLNAYLVVGVTLAQDWRVVCTSKATYVAPPGAGPCAVQDPALVALLRDPDEPQRTYAYEATTAKASTMALVFDPDGKLVAKTVKAYLTPVELPGQLDLIPGDVSGVKAVPTPVGRLGIVTSKDAWMPDITAKLDAERAEILVQPEFFVNDTVSTRGPWAPDNIQGAGPSDLLRYPSIKALALPQLSGNVFDFSADSQLLVAVKPRTGVASRGMVGQPVTPGYAAVGRYPVPDPAGESFAARRTQLGTAGEAMLPSGTMPCADPLLAGPCRGGQVEDVVAADVQVGATSRPRRPRFARRGPAPFDAARPLAAPGKRQRNVALAASGSTVLAAFEQADRVLVTRSRDGGARWSEPVAVARGGSGPQWWPSVSTGSDGTVWVAWQDGGRVRVAHTAAGAAKRADTLRFGAPVAAPGAGGLQWRPSIAATAAGTAYLTWVDEGTRFASDDLPQAALLGAPVTAAGGVGAAGLDRTDGVADLAKTLDNAWAPSVAARGGHVLVTWLDFRDYKWDVVARDSTDGGASYGAERTVNDTPADVEALEDSPRAALTATGKPVITYTDWFKDAASNLAPSRLYDTAVAGLAAKPVQADDHAGAHVSTFAPSLALTRAGDAVVAWQDMASGPARIRLARLRAAGGRRGRVLRVDDGTAPGAVRARPQVVIAGGRVLVAWEDERDGPSQLYTARAPLARVP